jgi:hypothetical protein
MARTLLPLSSQTFEKEADVKGPAKDPGARTIPGSNERYGKGATQS